MILISLKRAALFSAALFISADLSFGAPVDPKSKKTETAKDIVEKAYNLSLQKDRPQAINILVGAIKQENLRNGNTADLLKALQQVSYLFYSDRAQQNYELALSLRRTDLSQAQQKITEALRVEPDNLNLFNEQQRILMIKGDCSTVLENVTKERLQDPFDENLSLMQAQAQACLNKWDAYVKTRDSVDLKKTSLALFWSPLEIEYQISIKNMAKAKELAGALQKTDADYPEATYWRWRVGGTEEKQQFGQKYLRVCKNISPAKYRQYMTDVNLCRKVAEVESASKNGNGNSE